MQCLQTLAKGSFIAVAPAFRRTAPTGKPHSTSLAAGESGRPGQANRRARDSAARCRRPSGSAPSR